MSYYRVLFPKAYTPCIPICLHRQIENAIINILGQDLKELSIITTNCGKLEQRKYVKMSLCKKELCIQVDSSGLKLIYLQTKLPKCKKKKKMDVYYFDLSYLPFEQLQGRNQ